MSDQKETVFADGMIFTKKHDNAPAFVLGGVAIKVDDFIAFLQKHKKADGWVNLDLLKPQDATKKPYFKLNVWEKPSDSAETAKPITEPQPPAPEDLPW